jgi:membrane dipeptidase
VRTIGDRKPVSPVFYAQSASELAAPPGRNSVPLYLQFLILLSCAPAWAEVLIVDSHVDIPITLGTDAADPGQDGPMQVDIPKMRLGGVDAAFFIVYVRQGELDTAGYAEALRLAGDKFDAIERTLRRYPDELELATSPGAVRDSVSNGRLALSIGVENAYALGPELEHLENFYQRGARYVSLTHVDHNQLAGSSMARSDSGWGATEDAPGLSVMGRRLIRELNRLGIMVDVSHASVAATLEAAALSRAPVIASHSGARAVFDHPRNLSDEEILAIADTGGVIQLVAFDSYMRHLSEENLAAVEVIRAEMGLEGADWYLRATEEQLAEMRRRINALDERWPRATVATLVDHVDHVVALVGVGHAGIASDFGGGGGVKGWDDAGETGAVTSELLARGYSPEEVGKIWGGNLMRVWAEVEAAAEEN